MKLRQNIDQGKAFEILKSMLDKTEKAVTPIASAETYAFNYGALSGAVKVFLSHCTEPTNDSAPAVEEKQI